MLGLILRFFKLRNGGKDLTVAEMGMTGEEQIWETYSGIGSSTH